MEQKPENKEKSMILAVDDEPDILKIIKGIIQHAGFEAYCFTSPELALEHFRLNYENYHMILLDIRMPGINGFQFAEKAKKIKPSVKICLMSAFEIHSSEYSKVIPSVKIDVFIQKPVTMSKLSQLLF